MRGPVMKNSSKSANFMKKPDSFLLLVALALIFSCKNPEKEKSIVQNADTRKFYFEKGDSIVKITFDTLRAALKYQISENGVVAAIEYCNVNAYPITAFFAKEGIIIRRAAAKFRSPGNSPDSLEKIVIDSYQLSIRSKQSLKDTLFEQPGKMHFFKPIILQVMCKNCHGDPVLDISSAAWKEIKKRYPDDLASGFKEGDLRGIWHITFPE